MKKVTCFVAVALALLAVSPAFGRGGRGGRGCRGGRCGGHVQQCVQPCRVVATCAPAPVAAPAPAPVTCAPAAPIVIQACAPVSSCSQVYVSCGHGKARGGRGGRCR